MDIDHHDILRLNIESELSRADEQLAAGDFETAFYHLERAHILGQGLTGVHTNVHWRMLKLALKLRDLGEALGQIVRIVGAFTKTPFGIYPKGNTGRANVYFFERMPVPDDLRRILDQAGR